MEEDIEVLEKLASRTYKIDKDGWEIAVCSIGEQLAIRNIIARNKELEDDLYATNCIVNEQIDVLRNSIPKSKVEEIIKYKKQKLNNLEYSSDRYRRTCLQAEIDFGEELLQEGDK